MDEQSHIDEADSQPQPRRRRRPALSCQECRRRKIRCDQKTPCSHCARHKSQCIYREDDRPTASPARPPKAQNAVVPSSAISPPPSSVNSVSRQQQRPSTTARSPGPFTAQPRADNLSVSHTQTPVSQLEPPSTTPNQVNGIQEVLQKLQRLEEITKRQSSGVDSDHRSPTSGPSQRPSKRQRGDTSRNWRSVLNKSRDLGKGGWTELTPEFSDLISCWAEMKSQRGENPAFREPKTAELIKEAGEFMDKCKRTAKKIKIIRPTRGLSLASEYFAPPPRQMSDTMANIYFDSFESTHRILHAPSFWDEYRRYWDGVEPVTAELRLTVLLVIGIGSSLFDHGTPEATLRNMENVHHWIYSAETWLAGPLEKDRINISGLQLYCLTLLARQIFSMGGDTVWMSMGSLIHRAMQVGLHRDPQNLPGNFISVMQTEIRRRLWATILELAIQASLDSRMPPRLSLDEFDTEPPLNINDEELNESTMTVQPHPADHFTNTSIQLALWKSLPIRLDALKMMNGINNETPYHRVLALTSELTEALHENHDLMKSSQESTPFRRNLLDYLVRRFIIPLHFHFSNLASQNPEYYYSLKVSLDAAVAIMTPEPDPFFHRLMVSGGGLFREGVRVALMAPCLELLVQVRSQHLDGTLHRTNQYRDFLKRALRGIMALADERIHHDETNVKSYMFVRMVLAQVEAIEEDEPVALELARSARDSLKYSFGVLQTRADRISLASTPDTGLGMGVGLDVGEGMDLDWETFMPVDTLFS